MIICAALDEIGTGVIACVDPNPVVELQDWERVAHRATMITGSSPDALQEASEIAGGRFDFVLIDGDHSYEGVRRDIEGVLTVLEPDSHLLFHDSHYWQIKQAIDDALAVTSGLQDCGTLSREGAYEKRHELGQPVIWGGLRLLRFAQAGAKESSGEHHGLPPARVTKPPEALDLVDVSAHNAGTSPPNFNTIVSQVVSASQFTHPDFKRLLRTIFPGPVTIPWGYSEATVIVPHRKVWEFVYILRAAEQNGRLEPDRRAVGFGVGHEPIPAGLAQVGMTVLATDLDVDDAASSFWAAGAQHMSDLRSLSRPDVVPDDVLERQVSTRYVDMKDIPADLGRFDLVWSCCALEHLGSPEAGLEFVVRTLDLLEPGGVSVHTTELELTPRTETADYGNLAVYRKVDLDRLAERVRDLGFEIETNWYVSLETPADRWVSLPPYPHDDPAHLKLVVGDSVATSVGLLIRRPAE